MVALSGCQSGVLEPHDYKDSGDGRDCLSIRLNQIPQQILDGIV